MSNTVETNKEKKIHCARLACIKWSVRIRDGLKCVECGMTFEEHLEQFGRNLDVHRLQPGSEYTVEGCVTLCRPCHGPKPKSPRKRTAKRGQGKRPRVMFDCPPAVSKAVRHYAAMNHERVSTVICQALEKELAPEIEEAKAILASSQVGSADC